MPPPIATTQVWSWAAGGADIDLSGSAPRLLGEDELRRAAGMRPGPAAVFVAGRVAVRSILAGLLDTPGHEIELARHPCPGCGSADHGPPRIARPDVPLWISLSHTGTGGVLAVSPAPVGVDVESHREVDVAGLTRTALGPAETAWLDGLAGHEDRIRGFYRCWTRKEAVLKAIGIGLVGDLRRWNTRPWLDRAPVRDDTVSPSRRWLVENPPSAPGTTVAVARPAEAVAEDVTADGLTLLAWPPRRPRRPREAGSPQKAGQSAGSTPCRQRNA
ncbi:4'-phosphopantetheinyl transferase superfamily protein [Streptomyces sp. NPDC050732]|uniref:4'-phosphopantetheinyl transferase family protein n=1 Tax=Streptomyces sp. NPDC050732 TaxID=3154632 RepID=UPI0034378A4E